MFDYCIAPKPDRQDDKGNSTHNVAEPHLEGALRILRKKSRSHATRPHATPGSIRYTRSANLYPTRHTVSRYLG